eukprot:6476723-Amphidinium_carterae.1
MGKRYCTGVLDSERLISSAFRLALGILISSAFIQDKCVITTALLRDRVPGAFTRATLYHCNDTSYIDTSWAFAKEQ